MMPTDASHSSSHHAKKQRQRKWLRRYLKQFQLFHRPFASSGRSAHGSHYGFGAQSFWESLTYAWEGLCFVFQEERNFRLDCYLITGALVLGFLFQIPVSQWAILLQMAGFVLFAELANTVVEWLVDLLTEGRFDLRAKRIKDMAAGACLVVAVASYGVVALLFWPYFYEWFSFVYSFIL
ncbi:MAG: diacylglycerol kinase family protein [Vampirovibrio sp.]